MPRLLSALYRVHRQACLERFERLNANGEALNRIEAFPPGFGRQLFCVSERRRRFGA